MTEDERINKAVREATDLLHKAVPDAPFILVHVAGEKKNYGARYFAGAANQVNDAIKRAMAHSALLCADGLNSVIKQLAEIVPGAKKMMAPTPRVAIALLKEAIIALEMRGKESKKK